MNFLVDVPLLFKILPVAVTSKFRLHRALLVRRLGTLTIGAVSVAAVVSARHRDDALAACRELIEHVKAAVPIFKKELWQDGTTSWVDGI